MNGPFAWLALGFCLVLSFLMSGMEAGVFALSRLRVRRLMRARNPRARILYRYLEQPERFLWTILVGNTAANFVVACLVVAGLFERLGHRPVGFWSAFLVFVFLFYALCDLLPKMWFRQFPNRLCLRLAGPFRFVDLGLRPLIWLITWFSDEVFRRTGGKAFTGHLFDSRAELRLVLQESGQELTSEERVMINRVLDLQTLTVRQITVPLEKVVAVGSQTPMAQVLEVCRESGRTRLPVWQEEAGRRRIAGLISLSTVLYQPDLDPVKVAGDYVKPALYLDVDLRLEEALRRMQRAGQRLAIVLARDRRELGIVSLQDLLRAVFGEVNL